MYILSCLSIHASFHVFVCVRVDVCLFTHLQVYVTGTVLCMLKRKNCDHLFRFASFRKSVFTSVFQISASTSKGDSFDVTSNFVVPVNPIKQGSYLQLSVQRNLTVLTFELQTLGTCTKGYASLSEIEIFVDGQQPPERYQHVHRLHVICFREAKIVMFHCNISQPFR